MQLVLYRKMYTVLFILGIMSSKFQKISFTQSFFEDQVKFNDGKCDKQKYFLVFYIGESDWREEFTTVDDIMAIVNNKQETEEIFSRKKSKRKVYLLIDIDKSCAFIKTTDGIVVLFMEFRSISDIIYCGNVKQHSKHIILLINTASSICKAHLLSCCSVKDAKKLFKVFTDAFENLSLKKVDSISQTQLNVRSSLDGASHEDTGIHRFPEISSSTDEVDNEFTTLARSRLVSSDASKKNQFEKTR